MNIYRNNLGAGIRKWLIAMAIVNIGVLAVKSSNEGACESWVIYYDILQDLNYRYNGSSNCTIESGILKASSYEKEYNSFRFIKDLSLAGKENPERKYVIVESTDDRYPWHPEKVLICFYAESQEDNIIERKPIPHLKKLQKNKKRVLIFLITEKTKKVHKRRMKEALKLMVDQDERLSIKRVLEFLVRLINIHVCKKYINTAKNCSSLLEEVREKNQSFCRYYRKRAWLNLLKDAVLDSAVCDNNLLYWMLGLFESEYHYSMSVIKMKYRKISNKILERDPMSEKDMLKTLCILKEELEKEKSVLSMQIERFERECAEYDTKKEGEPNDILFRKNCLIERAKYLTVVYINIFSLKAIPQTVQDWDTVDKYIYSSAKRIEAQASPWNRSTVDILIKSWSKYMEAGKDAEKDIYDIVEIIRKENKKVLYELDRREKFGIECLYKHKIGAVLKEIEEVCDKKLFDQDFNRCRLYNTKNKEILKDIFDTRNIEICRDIITALVDTNIDLEPSKKEEVHRNTIDQVFTRIKEISRQCIEYAGLEEVAKCVSYHKKEISRTLHSIILLNKELISSKCEDLSVLQEGLKKTIEIIVSAMFYECSVLIDYSMHGALEKVIEKEKECIKALATYDAVEYLLKFSNDFCYSLEYNFKLVSAMKAALAQMNVSEYILDKWSMGTIERILMNISHAYLDIQDLNMLPGPANDIMNEVWVNPVVLYVGEVKNFNSIEKLAYIIYKEDDDEIYITQIDFTDKNLEIFRNAETLADIKAIKGREKENIKKFEENRWKVDTIESRMIRHFERNTIRKRQYIK